MAMNAGRDPLARDGKNLHGDSVPWCNSQSQCAGHHAAKAWRISGRVNSLVSDFTHAGALEKKIEQGALDVGDADNELAVIASVSSQQPDAAFAIGQTSNLCGLNGRKDYRFPVAHHSVAALVAAKCGEKASAPSARTGRSLIGGGVAACTKLHQLRHLRAAIAAAEIRQMEAQQGRQRTRVLLHSVIAKGSRSTARSIPESGIEPASVRSLPSTPATGQRSE